MTREKLYTQFSILTIGSHLSSTQMPVVGSVSRWTLTGLPVVRASVVS